MIISREQLDTILPRVTKPARYTGGEWNAVVKDWETTPLRVALAYPDLYEIGASNLAIPILYEIINAQPDALAERVYAPWPDMAAVLRSSGIPLYSLETKHAISDFDIFGFSLEHELTYTNVLEMLDLAGIPVYAAERDDSHPIVIAGGTCCLNPEPMADFIDLFCLGEGEELIIELLQVLREWKKQSPVASRQSPVVGAIRESPEPSPVGNGAEPGRGIFQSSNLPIFQSTQRGIFQSSNLPIFQSPWRLGFLRRAAGLEGVYVPSFYRADYDDQGLLKAVSPTVKEARTVIKRRILEKLPPPVTRPVVPYIEIIQDRAAIEIQRGCTRGCRFCQAGIVYRPMRERPLEEVVAAAGKLLRNTGYHELSLVSLSTSDYSGIDGLVQALTAEYQKEKLAVSLPSLRIDNFSVKLMESLPHRKKLALTFAPEAGSERLRCAINKAITDEQILETAQAAFDRGWTSLKLYFLLGLPTETEEDLLAIVSLVRRILALRGKDNGRHPQIKASLSSFVPKPHTPFQWAAQDSLEELLRKQDLLRRGLRKTGAQLSWNTPQASVLEAAFSRGDRRLGRVVHAAWQKGCVFDAWSERFDYEKWLAVFQGYGLDVEFFGRRERAREEVLPWSHISTGVTANYLWREYDCTLKGKELLDCRYGRCHACGLEKWLPQCRERIGKLED